MNLRQQNGFTEDTSKAGRIMVDLSVFFSNHKKFCIIYLDYDKYKTIRGLKKYLIDTFDIKKPFVLMLNNCLLLEAETLRVLQNEDVIWLADPENFHHGDVAVEATDQKTSKSKTRKSKLNTAAAKACHRAGTSEESSEDESENETTKRKQAKAASTVQKEKQKLASTAMEISESTEEEEPASTLKSAGIASGTSTPPTIPSLVESEGRRSKDDFDWSSAAVPKRKRIRKRRSKRQATNIITTEEVAVTSAAPPSVDIKPESSRVHIRFDADSQPAAAVESPSCTNSQDSPILELLKLKKPIVFERSRETPKAASKDWSSLAEGTIWACPTVTDKPQPEDIVAFKVLHIGENYTPELSPWIIARVTSQLLQEEDKLSLEIQRGSNPRYRALGGKFEIDDGSEEQQFAMTMTWTDMVTPRNVSSLK